MELALRTFWRLGCSLGCPHLRYALVVCILSSFCGLRDIVRVCGICIVAHASFADFVVRNLCVCLSPRSEFRAIRLPHFCVSASGQVLLDFRCIHNLAARRTKCIDNFSGSLVV